MLSQGKLASPFVHPRRASATASKAHQVPGAGMMAGSRYQKLADVSRNHHERRATSLAFDDANVSRREYLRERKTAADVMLCLRELADRMHREGQRTEGIERAAHEHAARAIIDAIVRMQTLTYPS